MLWGRDWVSLLLLLLVSSSRGALSLCGGGTPLCGCIAFQLPHLSPASPFVLFDFCYNLVFHLYTSKKKKTASVVGGVTNYAWYVQEVANKPHSVKDREWARPRSSNGGSCCTRRHSQRDPSVAATAVHMALLILLCV